ncbi:MAG: M1 family peptidase [Hydrotalea flava]|nr:M1 family peptidase [Hydrotalea flava]NIM38838.1 M1 family peptidase [Hydrotalea flava]NIN02783.1 M1 family peptidase [Hydrotalea flava]NIN14468.1 M1 family peptidase [Hydrotalea flava]NIO94764.1 M1 family peptidase [Hydrotalea flava]
MQKKTFMVICSMLLIIQIFAQPLYMPRNIKKVYTQQTRSANGMPGIHYWQNTGNYAIALQVAPPSRTVHGSEDITYFNNSPDSLPYLIIKLILNIHKPGALRYNDASATYLTSGVHIDKVSVNGKTIEWQEPNYHATWQALRLPKKLMPKDSVQLHIDWHYDASLESGREGMIDSTTFYLAYFYPRVAVYDDYNGWDKEDFTDQQEFYNDFNDYRLQVTVPKNFVVWATGNLNNPKEVLAPNIIERLEQAQETDSAISIATLNEMLQEKVTQQKNNTWKFSADNITDMALCVSDHYVWDAASIAVAPNRERVSVQSAYNDTAKDFHQMVNFAHHAIDWFSKNWPGVPYPFPKMTVCQGYADMEYPMMVNDGTNDDPVFSRFVAEHEIAHSYFPFYMGINENRFGFMDEGWATTFEYLIGQADLGSKVAANFYKSFRVRSWINDPSAEEDIPIITPANILRGVAYGNNAYGKASLGYLAVKDMLGDDLFKKCLHTYMNRWHGKHPIPWDFFNTFNDASGQNLNWFWQNWYFTNGYIDLAIQNVIKSSRRYTVTINNIGGFDAPFDLIVNYTDGSTDTLHQNAFIWKTNEKQANIAIETNKNIQTVKIDEGIFMDANTKDNSWQAQ